MTGPDDSEGNGPLLGFGAAAPWGERWFSEDKAERLIRTALANGITHFDTAGFYCGGEAEPRLGRILSRAVAEGVTTWDSLTVSTKVGKQIAEAGGLVRDFRPPSIEASVEAATRTFGGKPLDIVYLHGPNKHELLSSLPVLKRHKDRGRIMAIGVCTDTTQLMHVACHPDIDVIMARYNLLNTQNGLGFQEAKAAGKQLVAIAPLAQALWRSDLLFPRAPSHFWYLARALKNSPRETLAAQRARWLHRVEGWSPAALALAFQRVSGLADVVMTTSTKDAHIMEAAEAMKRLIEPSVEERLSGLLR